MRKPLYALAAKNLLFVQEADGFLKVARKTGNGFLRVMVTDRGWFPAQTKDDTPPAGNGSLGLYELAHYLHLELKDVASVLPE